MITFTRAGTYTFTITEDAGDTADVTYDTSEWLLTVNVTDDATGETNQLSAAATYAITWGVQYFVWRAQVRKLDAQIRLRNEENQ